MDSFGAADSGERGRLGQAKVTNHYRLAREARIFHSFARNDTPMRGFLPSVLGARLGPDFRCHPGIAGHSAAAALPFLRTHKLSEERGQDRLEIGVQVGRPGDQEVDSLAVLTEGSDPCAGLAGDERARGLVPRV